MPSPAARYQDELRRVVAQLRDGYRPERILLFGSVARGDVHEDSDLDLLLIKRTSKRWLDRAAEARLLLDTDLAVDVVVYTPDEFAQKCVSEEPVFRELLADARTLYDAEAA
jgi:predicted nucleotidyltransferase